MQIFVKIVVTVPTERWERWELTRLCVDYPGSGVPHAECSQD